MKLKNLRLSDGVVTVMALCGIFTAFTKVAVPFWVYLLLLVVYAILRWTSKESTEIGDI